MGKAKSTPRGKKIPNPKKGELQDKKLTPKMTSFFFRQGLLGRCKTDFYQPLDPNKEHRQTEILRREELKYFIPKS
ncbi:hypothetical protein LEP1GSC188_4256 [Leptospira weilii serovar Topaz str. LT2116]|uniref:Uncharacterized protein n=1 Tax=Leptospira weilii serovar Topaz str. LT2116 TaxID=1088540 RepID=M3H4U4_9LEPT|nr:hypothetical protein LEP1GSC188_4256 [Leptospira weilii serovar Topaz str. LT2116]